MPTPLDQLNANANAAGEMAPFPNENDFNNRRAWFFHTVLQEVKASNFKAKPPTGDPWLKYPELFRMNVDRVSHELKQTLERAAGTVFGDDAARDIFNLTYDVGMLSLMMASQRAHVFLEFCRPNQQIRTGTWFRDENLSLDTAAKVRAMTKPCLVRVADGEPERKQVLRQGEIMAA
jgi:hypothetical protein